jgi:hypothetical protein
VLGTLCAKKAPIQAGKWKSDARNTHLALASVGLA